MPSFSNPLQIDVGEKNEYDLLKWFDFNGRHSADLGKWMDHNRRLLAKYQSLVNTSITLDAMLDSEAIQSD